MRLKLGIPYSDTLVYGAGLFGYFSGFPNMRKLFGVWFLLLAVVCNPFPTLADGVLSSVSYLTLPEKLAVSIQPFDDSDDNLEIMQRIEEALRAEGYSVVADAPFVMNFEIRDRLGSLSTSDNRHLFRFESKGGRGGGENAKARVNVYDSQFGGLLNKGPAAPRVSNRTIYRLEVNIEKKTNNERLWDAWAEAELTSGDGNRLIERMVPVVVKNIGQTIKRKDFQVY